MKKIGFCSVMFFALVFTGHAASPIVNALMDPSIPVAKHAVVSIHNNVMVFSIDGELNWGASGNGTGDALFAKEPMVFLPPGHHTMVVRYALKKTDYNYGSKTSTTTTSQSDWFTISGTFESGHFYRAHPIVNEKTVSIIFVDETDPSVWSQTIEPGEQKNAVKRIVTAEKAVSKVKYPKELSMALTFQRAEKAAPSLLEGTWSAYYNKETGDYTDYIFTGQTWTMLMRSTITEEVRKIGNLPSTITEMGGGSRGTIEVKGNTLTMVSLQNFNDDVPYWTAFFSLKIAKKAPLIYTFSFDADGKLLLSSQNKLLKNLPPIVLTKKE